MGDGFRGRAFFWVRDCLGVMFAWVEVVRRSCAAVRMKVRPSWLNGLTKGDT